MAIVGGLLSIGFKCLNLSFLLGYLSQLRLDLVISLKISFFCTVYSFVSTGLALWAFGDVGSDIYLMITTYKPVRELQYYCFTKYFVVVY